jgi:hypothetical protein
MGGVGAPPTSPAPSRGSGPERLSVRGKKRRLGRAAAGPVVVAALAVAGIVATMAIMSSGAAPYAGGPPANGYFQLEGVGSWPTLPDDQTCAGRVHRSLWEPRPQNDVPNHQMPSADAVHVAFATRPRDPGAFDPRWNTWLLPRVDGQYTGTTDEIFQWAACKWGLSDNLLRAIAVRESTWYQYLYYRNGECYEHYGCGDLLPTPSPASAIFCQMEAGFGYDYQRQFGADLCPKTFSIVGVMSWQDPRWGRWPQNQNGTFPYARDSTAFALDYLGAELRGCYEGWETFLGAHGAGYRAGDIWGCVGAWYAGDWGSPAAGGYVARVRDEFVNHTWLKRSFLTGQFSCGAVLGCPI